MNRCIMITDGTLTKHPLQDDCLRLRVVDVALLHPSPL